MSIKTIKIWLTAAAATAAAFIAADASGMVNLPDKPVHWMGVGAGVFGIFGASPLGRLVFKDAVEAVPGALPTSEMNTPVSNPMRRPTKP